jgi:NDP-sugar pyrophosphorylase family protein
MVEPVLVVMAAGLGSRYGGLKQIEPVGPNGEIIIDYCVYDAVTAGFKKVVFIIKEEMEGTFRERTGETIEKLVDTGYVFQKLEDIPEGIDIPDDRKKPWGTGHAVLSCRDAVDTPFAVINADDFYGRTSFELLYDYLINAKDKDGVYDFCMAGFTLENTLTEFGHVARGVCTVDSDGYLLQVNERTMIKRFGDETRYSPDGEEWVLIPQGSMVSMNVWGFTPGIFKELKARFNDFLLSDTTNLLKDEFFLPSAVDSLIRENKARVRVLKSNEKWHGVTYKEDKANIKKAIAGLIEQGKYPENLLKGF